MTFVNTVVICDRCRTRIEGGESITLGIISATAGYYKRAGWWSGFMSDSESIVCDGCMQKSEAYKKVYGDV